MMEAAAEKPAGAPGVNGSGPGHGAEEPRPAREMSLHLLRMLETRLEAAGMVLQAEGNRIATRIQLQLLAAAAILIAIWGGIVLLAVALPPNLRVLVLSGVVAAFVIAAAWALLKARTMISGHGVGSLHWFVESLKADVEVLSRSLSDAQSAPPQQEKPESPFDNAA